MRERPHLSQNKRARPTAEQENLLDFALKMKKSVATDLGEGLRRNARHPENAVSVPSPSIHDFKSLERIQEDDDFTDESAASLFDMRPGETAARRAGLNLMSIFMSKIDAKRDLRTFIGPQAHSLAARQRDAMTRLAFASVQCATLRRCRCSRQDLRGGGRWAGAKTKEKRRNGPGGRSPSRRDSRLSTGRATGI